MQYLESVNYKSSGWRINLRSLKGKNIFSGKTAYCVNYNKPGVCIEEINEYNKQAIWKLFRVIMVLSPMKI